MKYINITMSLLVLIVSAGCERQDQEHTIEIPYFEYLFVSFWEQMDKNYVFWNTDSTDWEETYYQYRGIFSQLDINDDDDVKSSVRYFQEMTRNLTDGHYQINFFHSAITDSVINPLLERKRKLGVLGNPYSYFLKDSVYLDEGYLIGSDETNTLNYQPLRTICGEINGEILYFACNFFGLSQSYYLNASKSVKASLDFFFDWIENNSVHPRGIIIDVRNNPGGDLADLNFLLGSLIGQPLHIGYCHYKNGDNPSNLTPRIDAHVNPTSNTKDIQLPIVVLADSYSASLAELVVSAVTAFPQGTFIGETTWGAVSPVVPFEVYASGSFEIENFMHVQMSSCRFISLDENNYDGLGLTPNISIPHSAEAYSQGKDIQLEKAIELFFN
ncbi:S41 family peptidase [Tunicatimonas pelagia]|uniref:S41 family peptidase n=1 Tax=Tunicatimonas pelagia TaxID=931531 RepID=UPI0026667E7F|nr:S41 family peptidase [Tunicatimonas pelagia]WKN45086.1 S41 family peptidase [Tunicatimonas pelagia]